MGLSNRSERLALEAVLENTYLGLVTSAPTETDPGTEVTAAEYARQPWEVGYTEGDPTEAKNTAEVEFPGATSSWGTVSHVVIYDAATGGNYVGRMELRDPNDPETPLPKPVLSGDIVRFLVDTLVFRLE